MRIALAVALSAVALAVLPSGAAGAARGCYPKGSKTVLQKDRVRVFERRRVTWACSLTTGRRFELDNELALLFPQPAMAVSGTLLAYGLDVLEATETYTTVSVVDTARVSDGDFAVVAQSDEEPKQIGKVVLSPTGAAAYVACESYGPAPDPSECAGARRGHSVHVVPRGAKGTDRVVDDKGRIDPRSLRLTGGRVSWRRDGRRRSVALP
jgi:hypothetical protein